MDVIQKTGVDGYTGGRSVSRAAKAELKEVFINVSSVVDQFKNEMNWVEQKGNYKFSSFIIPPLQILAACINFGMLIISSSDLFEILFRSYNDILDSKELINSARDSIKK